MEKIAAEMLTMLKRLREWEAHMGKWDSPEWKDMRELIDRAEKVGVKTNDY